MTAAEPEFSKKHKKTEVVQPQETTKTDGLRMSRREFSGGLPDIPSRGGIPAWIFSLGLHVSLFVTLAVVWQPVRKGTGGEPGRPVGIAIVRQTQSGTEYFLTEGSASAGSESSASDSASGSSAEIAAALPGSSGAPIAESELLGSLMPTGSEDGGGTVGERVGGTGLGEGDANVAGRGGVPEAKTEVFGISGTGTRFLYVFDRSDSMNGYGGAPLAAAKEEMIKSIQSLQRVHQFQIVFYNDTPTVFRGSASGEARLLFADDANKRSAVSFVDSVKGRGGTEHVPALKQAIGMLPDVIFFLTDANLPAIGQRHMEEISNRATRGGTVIHCVEFGVGLAKNSGGWISQLAAETGGEYRYVNVEDLKQ